MAMWAMGALGAIGELSFGLGNLVSSGLIMPLNGDARRNYPLTGRRYWLLMT